MVRLQRIMDIDGFFECQEQERPEIVMERMKWLNMSYNDPSVDREVNGICGKPYGLWERFKLGGIGTARMELLDAPGALLKDIDRAEDRGYCQIEFRPRGLIIRCRSRLETLGVPLPYADLVGAEIRRDREGTTGRIKLSLGVGGPWLLRPHSDHWANTIALLRRHLPPGVLQ